ncbi:hypothetical protein V2A60_002198 [Cordyceps javanica]
MCLPNFGPHNPHDSDSLEPGVEGGQPAVNHYPAFIIPAPRQAWTDPFYAFLRRHTPDIDDPAARRFLEDAYHRNSVYFQVMAAVYMTELRERENSNDGQREDADETPRRVIYRLINTLQRLLAALMEAAGDS